MSASPPPVRFCFGLHLHQPVGNFGYVFEQHVRDVYLPFLQKITAHEFFPVSLHVSGPLLDWLEAHDTRLLDVLGHLAADGRLELLLAGYYEPVLASLPREDRIEQVLWMREALRRRFGVEARGLWLTERVWEPDLAADLHDAGVAFALVDDRHFLVSGFDRAQLHAPLRTEHDGKPLALFPIDERLRYLIPFQPAEDTAAYLRSLRARGHQLAVLADDGEKFGGWPGTLEWVYQKGWLDSFMSVMRGSIERGEVLLSRFDDALSAVPSGGLAYLSTASYREMEGWSLPAPAALRLHAIEKELGEQRLAGAEGALIRGAHWRNFLVKYAESNRMHKKMQALSALCRRRGNPDEARRAIGRAQCNDAYWHGVFGGLYLPFLRAEIWRNLAHAERVLREGEGLHCEEVDIDGDGHTELWVHAAGFSCVVSPRRGGAIEELTHFARGANVADALTRRREAYHVLALADADADAATAAEQGERGSSVIAAAHGDRGTESIHDIEQSLRLAELPPADLDDRALFVDRAIGGAVSMDEFAAVRYRPVESLAAVALEYTIERHDDRVEIRLRSPDGRFQKDYVIFPDGGVRAKFTWEGASWPTGSWFTTEISCASETAMVASRDAVVWSYPIETVAKSERGLDRTLQGTAYLVRWPAAVGTGDVELPAPRA